MIRQGGRSRPQSRRGQGSSIDVLVVLCTSLAIGIVVLGALWLGFMT